MSHGQTLDLQTLGCLYERAEVLLTDGYFPPVHVEQELLHVPGGHSVQVDDVVLLLVSVLREEAPEVGGADGEDQLVGGEVVLTTRYGHVDEKLPEKE